MLNVDILIEFVRFRILWSKKYIYKYIYILINMRITLKHS